MHDGKKSIAQKVFYDALDIVKEKVTDVEPIEVFTQAVENVKPAIEVRSKRVGGAAYQVPMQVNRNRQQSLAIRWILHGGPREEGPPDPREAGRGTGRRLQREGAAMSRARERPSHGRRQQGLRPLRLVRSQSIQAAVPGLGVRRGDCYAPGLGSASSRARASLVPDIRLTA